MIISVEELGQLEQLADSEHPFTATIERGRYAISSGPEYEWAREQVADWRVQRGQPALMGMGSAVAA